MDVNRQFATQIGGIGQGQFIFVDPLKVIAIYKGLRIGNRDTASGVWRCRIFYIVFLRLDAASGECQPHNHKGSHCHTPKTLVDICREFSFPEKQMDCEILTIR